MNDKPKGKLRWRLLRWGLITLAILATFAAVLVTEEDWRGKRAWENYKRDAGARGERLDVASVIPPLVPDDQNFFCAPVMAKALNSENQIDFSIYRGDYANQPKHSALWQKSELTDLKEWQVYFRNYNETPEGKTNGFPMAQQPQTPAAGILLALSCFDPALEKLRQASQRPYARIPINYEDDFGATSELMPCLANMKRIAQFLHLRILAELQNNQGDRALADVKLLLHATDSIREQPFLISHLVRIAMLAITVQPVYEGLARHSWSDAQIRELQPLLAGEDLLSDYEFALRSEKLFAIDTFERQRITREMVSETGDPYTFVTNSLRLAPSAFFYQTELSFARMHQEYVVPLVDLPNRIVAPAGVARVQAAVQSQMKHYSYYKIQAQMVVPAIAASVAKFATIQAQLDLAQTACALERYRLAHAEYPASLDLLTPQFIDKLPHDIINGRPLHYRRTDDGKFVLYSVGWNETDDGGQVALTKSGGLDGKKGDWVWKY